MLKLKYKYDRRECNFSHALVALETSDDQIRNDEEIFPT